MRQQLSCLMSFVAEIRLNAKDGTHKTLVRIRCSKF
jgi:hypothetical protein